MVLQKEGEEVSSTQHHQERHADAGRGGASRVCRLNRREERGERRREIERQYARRKGREGVGARAHTHTFLFVVVAPCLFSLLRDGGL